jgi:hypothetical protein
MESGGHSNADAKEVAMLTAGRPLMVLQAPGVLLSSRSVLPSSDWGGEECEMTGDGRELVQPASTCNRTLHTVVIALAGWLRPQLEPKS